MGILKFFRSFLRKNKMSNINWKPITLDECMDALSQVLSKEDNADLIASSENDLIRYHFGLGTWIRNNWNLWAGGPLLEHMKSLGFMHPDDMSQTIIEEYWARKNNKPSKIQEKVKKYGQYWEEMQKGKGK